MAVTRTRSDKGRREIERLLGVATSVLAEEGLDRATLGRIAEAASVDKRMLAYYFQTRELLLAEVVRAAGQLMAQHVRTALSGLTEPAALAEVGIDALWAGATAKPELTRAYLALATNRTAGQEVRQALDELRLVYLGLIDERVGAALAAGHRLQDDRAAYVSLVLAMLRGLLLEWAEDGETPRVREGVELFKRVAISRFTPASG